MAPVASLAKAQAPINEKIAQLTMTNSLSNGLQHTQVNRIQHVPGRNSEAPHLSSYGNPSLHVTPQHKIDLRDTEVPQPNATQALIHVRASGICGSDLHLWHRGAIGPLTVDCDNILGHEASGVVLSVGSDVNNLRPGDRVAIEPGVPCHKCFLCASGKYNLCESVEFAGVGYAGSIRRFMVHDARYCHKIPDSMTFSQGALLEPLSVIAHAIRQCKGSVQLGRPLLVCGAGPIGLIALAAARASGAWPLVITDVQKSRLDFAQKFVPGTLVYHVQQDKPPLQCSEEIRELFGCGTGRDIHEGIPAPNEYYAPTTVLECTGIESSVITAAYSCRRAGVVMVVGVGRSTMNNLPFMYLSLAEIELKFINRYVDTWPSAIAALCNGQVLNLDALVTHTFPLSKAVEAMELSADRSKGSIKVQIVDDMEITL